MPVLSRRRVRHPARQAEDGDRVRGAGDPAQACTARASRHSHKPQSFVGHRNGRPAWLRARSSAPNQWGEATGPQARSAHGNASWPGDVWSMTAAGRARLAFGLSESVGVRRRADRWRHRAHSSDPARRRRTASSPAQPAVTRVDLLPVLLTDPQDPGGPAPSPRRGRLSRPLRAWSPNSTEGRRGRSIRPQHDRTRHRRRLRSSSRTINSDAGWRR